MGGVTKNCSVFVLCVVVWCELSAICEVCGAQCACVSSVCSELVVWCELSAPTSAINPAAIRT